MCLHVTSTCRILSSNPGSGIALRWGLCFAKLSHQLPPFCQRQQKRHSKEAFVAVSSSVSSFIPIINSINYLMCNWQGSQWAANASFSSADSAKTREWECACVCVRLQCQNFHISGKKLSVSRLMINEVQSSLWTVFHLELLELHLADTKFWWPLENSHVFQGSKRIVSKTGAKEHTIIE